MKKVTLGLIQMKMSKNLEANLEKASDFVIKAALAGARVICLPELYRSIYFPQYKKQNKNIYAESVPGRSTRLFSSLAKKYGVVIVVPVYEKDARGKFHNSAVVINEKGKLIGTYHKIHIPQDPLFYEKDYFTAGDTGYKIFKTKFGNFAVLICYDQWFPEAARMATLGGADLIFYPTAIGNIVGDKASEGDWHMAWETVMRGHAIANAVYVAAVNRSGREDRLNFWGQSFVADSFGKVLKRASASKEEVVLVEIDLAKNKFIREGWGFFRNRRSDTYKL